MHYGSVLVAQLPYKSVCLYVCILDSVSEWAKDTEGGTLFMIMLRQKHALWVSFSSAATL